MVKNVMQLLNSERFAKQLAECKTVEETLSLFAENGVKMTAEQLKGIITSLSAKMNGELDDDSLDGVSGGNSDEIALEEMLKYSNNNILISAMQSMMQQANPQQDNILSLLS